MATNLPLPPLISSRFVRWIPPIQIVVNINTDASRSDSSNVTCLGVVVRNSLGKVLLTGIDYITGLLDPATVEAKPIFLGLSIAIEGGFSNLVVESDCAYVIKLLNGNCVFISDISLVLSDIQELLRPYTSNVSFSHVCRGGNMVAHFLVKLAVFFF
ncbi:hypothetical protein ACOSQ4_032199 [Xanthoceras sorbifolium]